LLHNTYQANGAGYLLSAWVFAKVRLCCWYRLVFSFYHATILIDLSVHFYSQIPVYLIDYYSINDLPAFGTYEDKKIWHGFGNLAAGDNTLSSKKLN